MLIYKKDIAFINNNIVKFGDKNKFVLDLLRVLTELQNDGDSKFQLSYYKRILKTLLFDKFGADKLFVTNINEVYPSEYPLNNNISENEFEQFEIVLDCSNKKFMVGIVLDIFDGVYVSDTKPSTQEIRLDSNGVMCDDNVRKLNLINFIKRLDFTNDFCIRLLKGLLIEAEKYVAVAVNKDFLVVLSKPCTYKEACVFNGSQLKNERFKIVTEKQLNSFKNVMDCVK